MNKTPFKHSENNLKKVLTIKIVAAIIAAVALYNLIPALRMWSSMIFHSSSYFSPDVEVTIPLWVYLVSGVLTVIDFLKLRAAYGLFKLKSWGRNFAVAVLAADSLIGLYGVINISLLVFRSILSPPVINEIAETQYETVTVKVISLWPPYIILALNLIFLIILLRKNFKQVFERGKS